MAVRCLVAIFEDDAAAGASAARLERDLLAAIARALAARPKKRAGGTDAAAVARVAALSPRQRRVLEAMVDGRPNRIIACELGLGIRAVEACRARMLEKLGVRGTAEAIRLAIAGGIRPG